MDERQQQELRDWAERLAAASDAERRATGRAILTLLAQIEALQAELDAASSPATRHEPSRSASLSRSMADRSKPSTAAEADLLNSDRFEQGRDLAEPLPDDAGAVADTEVGLRGRVRRAARHLRAENRN